MRRGFHALAAPGLHLGTWTQFADEDVVDLLGAAGFAFTIIDAEHGAFGIETVARLVRACEAAGLVALVRVPRGDHGLAAKALDSGAAGIVAPGVESAEETRAWVRALRFAPAGTRGACPIVRAAGHSLAAWQDAARAQDGNGLVVLVETAAGVAAASAIAQVPGVAGLMLGPFDLSASLGCAGDVLAPEVQAGVEAVLAAAQAAGVAPWLPVFAPEPQQLGAQVAQWRARGVRHFPIGADKLMLAAALRGFLAAARC